MAPTGTGAYRWALARLPTAEFAVAFHDVADEVIPVRVDGRIVATATVVRSGNSLSGAPVTVVVVADSGPAAVELGTALGRLAASWPAVEVLGPGSSASQVTRVLTDHTGGVSHEIMRQRLWVCTEPQCPQHVRGSARPMEPRDLATVARWMDEFSAEALRLDPRGVAEWRVELHTVTGMRVWEVDGEIVSMCLGRQSTPVSARVGPVFTPRGHRGNGYAAALTVAVTREWLDRGLDRVVLLTDVTNPTSNRLYARVGYVDVGGHASWFVRWS